MPKKLSIVFENNDFIALNKPAGMLSIPDREQSGSLKEILAEKYGRIFTVHRLDKDTSGLILFAKNEKSHKYLSQLFQDRKIEKYYLGVVHGLPSNTTGTIDAAISEHRLQKGVMTIHRDGKPSLTTYEVINANKHYSLLSFQLHTGRTHQIRIHTKHIGHPLVFDPIYGDGLPLLLSSIKKKYKLSKNDEAERPIINRLALHSYKLKFENMHGQHMELTAEIPKEFTALMKQLNKINA